MSATGGADYVATSGTLNFDSEDSSKQVTVTINDDSAFENDESFTVDLTNPTNASIDDSQATATITDDDEAPGFDIDDVTVSEDAGSVTFTVVKSGTTEVAASVDFDTPTVPLRPARIMSQRRGPWTSRPVKPSRPLPSR